MESGDTRTFLESWLEDRLGFKPPGDAEFAAVGLDSFDIVALADDLGAHLDGRDVSLIDIIEHPTVDGLVAIYASGGAAHAHPEIPNEGRPPGEVASYWQEAVLEWEGRHEPSATFNICECMQIDGPLDVDALQKAVAALVERQGALRQTFIRSGTGSARPASDYALQIHEDVDGDGFDAWYRALGDTPFPLAGEPLVQFHLVVLADHHRLVMVYHQLVHDGLAGRMVFEELGQHYREVALGEAAELTPLNFSYADHAAWERAYYTSERAAEQVSAQTERIAGARPLDLADRRPERITPAATERREFLDGRDVEHFSGECERQGITFFAGVCTLAVLLCSNWAGGQGDITVVVPTSTRKRPDLAGLVGRFGAWVPIRVRIAEGTTVGEVCGQVAEQQRNFMAPIPGPILFGQSDIFGHPLTRVVVNAPGGGLRPTPWMVGPLTFTYRSPYNPLACPPELAIRAVKIPDRIAVIMDARSDLFDDATLDAHFSNFVHALKQFNGEMPVAELFQDGVH